MTLALRMINTTIKGITRVLCRIEDHSLGQIPARGPLILVGNHINFIDAPIMYTHLLPRPLTAFAKVETWDNPWLGSLFTLWGAIPIHRGEADVNALRQGLHALQAGRLVAITPEGTRSGDGRLRRGHPGVVTFALLSGAPLLPVVCWGQETLNRNLHRLRRTDFHIQVGKPFHLDVHQEKVTQVTRQAITDEIMYQLAGLLPPDYRGVYANLSAATTNYLRFI